MPVDVHFSILYHYHNQFEFLPQRESFPTIARRFGQGLRLLDATIVINIDIDQNDSMQA